MERMGIEIMSNTTTNQATAAVVAGSFTMPHLMAALQRGQFSPDVQTVIERGLALVALGEPSEKDRIDVEVSQYEPGKKKPADAKKTHYLNTTLGGRFYSFNIKTARAVARSAHRLLAGAAILAELDGEPEEKPTKAAEAKKTVVRSL